MVFYFKVRGGFSVYMGKDKFENEELIKWGWPEDVWFHVRDHSSAHVYLRLPKGQTIEDIPEDALEDCCQLVKENSIEGCKLKDVKVVYTPWANLLKRASMEVGQVGFKDEKAVKMTVVAAKDKLLIKRLEKTREEKENVDFEFERLGRDRLERNEKKVALAAKEAADTAAAADQKKKDDELHYVSFMKEGATVSNRDMAAQSAADYEDDFFG